MGPGQLVRSLATCAVVAGVVAAFPGTAHAIEPLTEDERGRLAAGNDIVREDSITLDNGQRFVGGLGYVVLPISAAELVATLSTTDALREILPRTQEVIDRGRRGGDTLLELHQGNALIHASYTIRVRHEPLAQRFRFWLDRSRPHAMDDAWGFFRYEPFSSPEGPRVLVSYGVMVDLGSGMLRSLYEARLRALALTVPHRLREYVDRKRSTIP